MELEQIREKWTEVKAPSYSKEELESIFNIKQSNVLHLFKSGVKKDLLISEVLVVSFIILLQIMDLRTSDFWSIIMGFIGFQHLLIYLLQSVIIRRLMRFNENVYQSVESSLESLQIVLWLYRIVPVLLSSLLYTIYVNQFVITLSSTNMILVGIGLAVLVLIISEYLSSVMVKTHLRSLNGIKSDLLETNLLS